MSFVGVGGNALSFATKLVAFRTGFHATTGLTTLAFAAEVSTLAAVIRIFSEVRTNVAAANSESRAGTGRGTGHHKPQQKKGKKTAEKQHPKPLRIQTKSSKVSSGSTLFSRMSTGKGGERRCRKEKPKRVYGEPTDS